MGEKTKNLFILRPNSSIVKTTRGGTRRREGRVDMWQREIERKREKEREARRVEEVAPQGWEGGEGGVEYR